MFMWCYDVVLVKPLRQLYFYGPAWSKYGGWAGKLNKDICYEMTGIESGFWARPDNQAECFLLIERHFASFNITVVTLLYFVALGYAVWNVKKLICSRCCHNRKDDREVVYVLPSDFFRNCTGSGAGPPPPPPPPPSSSSIHWNNNNNSNNNNRSNCLHQQQQQQQQQQQEAENIIYRHEPSFERSSVHDTSSSSSSSSSRRGGGDSNSGRHQRLNVFDAEAL